MCVTGMSGLLQEDIKLLVSYVVERHFAAFEGVTYVQTFRVLKQRHEQQLDRALNKPVELMLEGYDLQPGHTLAVFALDN